MFLDPDWEGDGDPFPNPFVPPDSDPLSGDLIHVELNRDWLPFITGACTTLVQSTTWNTSGDEEFLELTRLRAMTILTQLNTPVLEQPFYDDDDNVDGSPDTGYPWYEQLSDWIISAFLALTFTPGAAVVYKTTIPQLRLAFRTGSLGAIVRVLLNDVEVWTGNTNSEGEGLLTQAIDAAAFALENELGDPPWDLRIEHGGPPDGIDYDDPTYPKGLLQIELGDIRPRGDTVLFRQSGCVLETSIDGETWETLFDPTDCVNGLIADGIQDAIDDGTLERPGGQPGPSEPPPNEECRSYHVVLPANSQWHLPSPMNYEDTLTVSNMVGGWTDGTLVWFCPDGHLYYLGACQSGSQDPDEGDPLQTGVHHMGLVMQVGEDWYPAPVTGFQYLSGINPLDVIFQANDGSLSDNTGQIEFDVTVCRAPELVHITVHPAGNVTVPEYVAFGEEFDLTARYNANQWYWAGIRFSTPVIIEIVSRGNATPYWDQGGGVQSGDIYWPDNSAHGFGYALWPVGPLSHSAIALDLNGNPANWTCTLRLTRP